MTPTALALRGLRYYWRTNLAVIAGMIVLFAIALVLPFPHTEEGDDGHHD